MRGFSAFFGAIAARVPFRHSAIRTKFGVRVTNVPDRPRNRRAIGAARSTTPRSR